MLYSGASITRGTGKGIVVRTGIKTEIGKISELVEEASLSEKTPLENRLEELGERLVWLSGVIIFLIVIVGLMRGQDIFLLFETAVALAVATVPEGLPIVATITLARGMKRMADNNALVNQLSSVETLGSTNVIATDKTGTLTENMMTVTQFILPNKTDSEAIDVSGTGFELEGDFNSNGAPIDLENHPVLTKAIQIGVLCNNSNITKDNGNNNISVIGDPMETAILIAAEKANLDRKDLMKQFPERKEVSFDPKIMMMATYNEIEENVYMVAVKGSPDEVLTKCTQIFQNGKLTDDLRDRWIKINNDLAKEGNRILAVATKTVSNLDTPPYNDLEFVGLISLHDPPRLEVKNAIKQIHRAGIKLVMVTGDQKLTAINIANQLDMKNGSEPQVMPGSEIQNLDYISQKEQDEIVNVDLFYRVEPKEKLNLVKIYQEQNQTIAMTGDGVNDAPALRKADIGVAMGLRGTQVAKQAADMILQDDDFSTIEKAIQEGRNIFKSIQKFVYYLLSCNISEIMVIFFATLFFLPLPILPIQILFLNIVTDIFPAFALSMNKGDRSLMNEPPRNKSDPILTKRQWAGIMTYGLLITASVLGGFIYSLEFLNVDEITAITIAYMTLGFAQVWHVFNMRDSGSSVFSNMVTQNRNVWFAIVLSLFFVLITVYLPGLQTIMKTVPIGFDLFAVVVLFSLIPVVVGVFLDKLDLK